MKKQLLGTTALVAAGVLALSGSAFAQAQPAKVEPIKLSLGGFHDQRFHVFDVDDRAGNVQKVDFEMDSEVYFSGNTTLDNGLKFTVRIELEGNNQTNGSANANRTVNFIDENFLTIESGFGSVQLGTTDDVRQKMGIRPVNAGWGTTQGRTKSGANRTASSTDSTVDTTAPDLFQNDAEKINYFTPRLLGTTPAGGLQLGVSYTPTSVVSGFGSDNTSIEQKSGKYNRGVTLGFNYTETFSGVAVAVGGGWMRWDTDQRDVPEAEVINAGFNIGYAGFTLGASYGRVTDGLEGGGCAAAAATAAAVGATCVSQTINAIDGDAWDVGLAYNFGPGRVSLIYLKGENEGIKNFAGDDEGQFLVAGGEYTLGPGVRWSTSLWQFHFRDESPGNAGATGGAVGYGGSAYGLITGIRLAF